jgi:DNA repair protein RecO (recombination protein O)
VKQTDTAIFIHRVNYSESSLIVTFYTLQNGIQKFIFQGGKKKGTALFPLSICEIIFYRRPDSELGKLTESKSHQLLQDIPINPEKATIAFFMVDVLKQCLQTDQRDIVLFQYLESTIISLNNTTDLSLFATEFLINFSLHMGIDPHIQESNKRYFHLQDGDFSDFDRKGELVADGPEVQLIQSILRKETIAHPSRALKSKTFDVMIHYYKLHVPNFNIQKSLDVIKEILYA